MSVIIPFFNVGNFLEETIASVFAQTYKHWQLLLIDDGSSDDGTDIARRCANENPGRVLYFDHYQHRNRGVCCSRNLGVKHATGEYLALLDADDVWLPHKLERQLAILRAHPAAGLVFGVSQYWVSWTGELAGDDSMPALGIQLDRLFRPPSLLFLLYPLGRGGAPCPSDLLLARELVERIGGFEEQFDAQRPYQLYEDQAFLVKVYSLHRSFRRGSVGRDIGCILIRVCPAFCRMMKSMPPRDCFFVNGSRSIWPSVESRKTTFRRLSMDCGGGAWDRRNDRRCASFLKVPGT